MQEKTATVETTIEFITEDITKPLLHEKVVILTRRYPEGVPPAVISYSQECTWKQEIKDTPERYWPSLKASVFISVPCLPQELDQCMNYVTDTAQEFIALGMAKVKNGK